MSKKSNLNPKKTSEKKGNSGNDLSEGNKVEHWFDKHLFNRKKYNIEKEMLSVQQSLLAAKIMVGTMNVDEPFQQHVVESISIEMMKKHVEREQRRNELLKKTKVRFPFPWKTKSEKTDISTLNKKGATVYPIRVKHDLQSISNPEFSNPWSFNQKAYEVPGLTKNFEKRVLTQPTTNTERKPTIEEITSIFLDKKALSKISDQKFVSMVRRYLTYLESLDVLPIGHMLRELSVDEMITLRRTNPRAYDIIPLQNALLSFALAKPTPDDYKNVNSNKDVTSKKEPKKNSKITFDGQIDVVLCPVGTDFSKDEKKRSASIR